MHSIVGGREQRDTLNKRRAERNITMSEKKSYSQKFVSAFRHLMISCKSSGGMWDLFSCTVIVAEQIIPKFTLKGGNKTDFCMEKRQPKYHCS